MMLRKLTEIRQSDAATKLRWLIALSVIALLLVGGVWLLSLRIIIASIGKTPPPQTETASATGALRAVGNFFAGLSKHTTTAIENLKESISQDEITLTPAAPVQ